MLKDMFRKEGGEEAEESWFESHPDDDDGHVLHHCVVILVWSSGIMDCMLFTFQSRVQLMC